MEHTPFYYSSPFDAIRKTDERGQEYWSARDLQAPLGYEQWRQFEDAIERAKIACQNSGEELKNHFADVRKMVSVGSGAEREIQDYQLSRYACYLTAMNGDPRKPEISAAQTYFAVKTREAETAQETLQGPTQRSAAQRHTDDFVERMDRLSTSWMAFRKEMKTLGIEAPAHIPTQKPTQKQLPMPKDSPEQLRAAIVKHLKAHGALTLNTLRGSYLKGHDAFAIETQMHALMQAGRVRCFQTSHATKYELVEIEIVS